MIKAEKIRKMSEEELNHFLWANEYLLGDLEADVCMELIKRKPWVLAEVNPEIQTEEMCMIAVKQEGYALQNVINKTPEIILEAIKQNGLALQFVENPSDELCKLAMEQNPVAILYSNYKPYDMWFKALKEDPEIFWKIKEQTPELCLEAVRLLGNNLKEVEEQTPEICLAAVKQNGMALEYVKEQTYEICLEAVKQTFYALYHINEVDVEDAREKICDELGLYHLQCYYGDNFDTLTINKENGVYMCHLHLCSESSTLDEFVKVCNQVHLDFIKSKNLIDHLDLEELEEIRAKNKKEIKESVLFF